MKTAANSPDKCILAVVIVDGNRRSVAYFLNWIDNEPSFSECMRSLDLKKLRQVSKVILEKEIMV